MNELDQLRAEIDAVDARIAALFERRMTVAEEIAAYKRARDLPVYDPNREALLLARSPALLEDSSLLPYYRELQRKLFFLSRQWQQARISLPPDPEAAQHMLPLAPGGCWITLCRGLLAKAGRCFRLDRRVLVVTDDGVPAGYAATVAAQCAAPTVVTLPQGEAEKTLAQAQRLLTALLDGGFTRYDCIVAVGGGVVCDLAGFAAAIYQRGIDFYSVPTTLLAQLDAAIGGKNGCNLGGVKNQIGTVRQPLAVLIDPDLLHTLPPRQLSNGLAEAVKAALIGDPALFALLEGGNSEDKLPEIIERALSVKCNLVLRDETDHGLRKLLNLGHTLGHGLEATTGLLHGECVALGMLPMCSPSVRARLLPLLRQLGLPTTVQADADAVLRAVWHDKKSHGEAVDAVTAEVIGAAAITPLTQEALRQRLAEILRE